MALRRLLSGWLIAVADLARAMALALERAAERAGPVPSAISDPIMTALAERYPGAPAHWLAHVAERTAQLADDGTAPLSMSSQASAWPSSLPGAGPLAPLMPEDGGVVPAETPRPIPSSKPDAVPSMATLRGRSSEVWRRPEDARGRRQRPVFALASPAPERERRAVVGEVARRARSPLALNTQALSEPMAKAPPPVAPKPPVTPKLEATARSHAWSGEGLPSAKAAPTAAVEMVRKLVGQPIRPSSDTEMPRAADVFAKPEVGGAPVATTSRKTPASKPVANEAPGRASGPPTTPTSPIAAGAEPRPSFPPPSAASVRRAPIFQASAAAPAQSVGAHARAIATMSQLQSSPPAYSDPSETPRVPTAMSWTPSLEAGASHDLTQAWTPTSKTRRAPSPKWGDTFTREEASGDQGGRFAIDRPLPAGPGVRQVAQRRADDRWPRFPPSVFTAPVTAEIPPPRLDQLAREQEEGRWSV